MKYSKQRELVHNLIQDSHLHLTADDIYSTLKKDNPNLSLGTVYRNLAQLVEHKMIMKISTPDQPDYYDKNVDEHFHFFCTTCGSIEDLHMDELTDLQTVIEKKTGVIVQSLGISLKGICKACQ